MLLRRAAVGVAMSLLCFSGLGAAVLVAPDRATAHTDPCHTNHTCPSDHHTYVWIDPNTGLGWDCARPGATEYDPSKDTTTIVWEGLTYYCRSASGTSTSTTTTNTTTTTTTAPTTTTTTTAPTS